MTVSRRRLLTAALAGPVLLAGSGCDRGSAPAPATIRIGMITKLTGELQAPGFEVRDGFSLYLDMHGGRLGGYPAELLVADEKYTSEDAVAAATGLLGQGVSALTGIVDGGNVTAVRPALLREKVPLVGALGRPALTDVSYVWHTNLVSVEPGVAMAPVVRRRVRGKVYAIGPNFQSGRDELRGFVETFTKLGGRLANPNGKPTATPFPGTTDFTPYLDAIATSGAAAVYCFFGGRNAIDFVTQYADSQVADLPLYAAGFLTEGALLAAQGDSAAGIYNALNYSPDLDNAENRTFVAAWTAAYPDRVPTSIAVASYDAAAVLDRAIAAAGPDPTPDAINSAIATLGQLDSPRGPWQFAKDTHAPIQKWYLRQVRRDGRSYSNVVVSELGTLGGG